LEAIADYLVGKQCPNSPVFLFMCTKMCLLAVYVPQDSGEDFRLVGCGSVLSGKSVPSHGTGLQPLCFLDLRNRIHILNRSVGKKYPVTLVQIFRHTSTEGRMLHYVLTALGIILFLVVAVFRAVFSYNWTWLCRRADCKKIDKIPGPKPIPFFGNMFLFILPEEGKCLTRSGTKF
jgi:hypothetical protein